MVSAMDDMFRKIGAGRRNASPRIFVRDGGRGIAARNETKSRTLFRMSFAGPTGGLQVTGPGEVIHRLAWPQNFTRQPLIRLQ
jgi:hypothetical protein